MKIPFNRAFATGQELEYISEAIASGQLSGAGKFTRRCEARLVAMTGAGKALLTTSCTAALEMAALLVGLSPGDEVIMPSYTFVSTANAVALRGAVPVFVDIRPDSLNLDETLVEAAITPKTKMICVVHYAGVACAMDPILEIAGRHGSTVVEDAAQSIGATYKGRALGSLGALAALSFHDSKNIIAGEGGALLVNDASLEARAEIIWEKGTDRMAFFRGQVDKYTWVDLGSSYLPSEITAAFLLAQLESVERITAERFRLWRRYHEHLAGAEAAGSLARPQPVLDCEHNAHIYYVVLPSLGARTRVAAALAEAGILAVFHYVPLHSSPAGRRYGRAAGPMRVTDRVGDCLLRLPMWVGLPDDVIDSICEIVTQHAR